MLVVRIDRGEEILEKLRELAEKESIQAASLNGIGAVGEFVVGVFKTKEKRYESRTYSADYEILSLCGTIGTMNGDFYCHLHMSAADETGVVVGGHLNRAVVSATCEIVLRLLSGRLERRYDPETGLNLLSL